MMLHEVQLPGPAVAEVADFLLDQIRYPQFLPEPHGHGLVERPEATGTHSKIGPEKPREGGQGLVIEDDGVDLVSSDSPGMEAVGHRVLRKVRIILLAGKPLLLSCRGEHS